MPIAVSYPPKVKRAVDSLLNNPAKCTPTLRRAVEAYAAGLSGSTDEATALPASLVDYVRKVTLHAYETTDGDLARLREAGYSDDEIFEITLCASIGAGLGRMERGLAILKGGR